MGIPVDRGGTSIQMLGETLRKWSILFFFHDRALVIFQNWFSIHADGAVFTWGDYIAEYILIW